MEKKNSPMPSAGPPALLQAVGEPVRWVELPRSAPDIILCVDALVNRRPAGRIFNAYIDRAIAFEGLTDMLLKVDDIYDYLELPQADRKSRSFRPESAQGYVHVSPRDQRYYQQHSIGRLGNKTLAIFTIQTRFRQQGTWQGSVVWNDTQDRQQYISALQLLKLVSEALEIIRRENDL